MARQLDRIVVVDVESTCWERRPPAGQESEIIEIGVCLLDPRTGERSDKQSLLVAPTRSSVSDFCTKLTTLTAKQVAEGMTFHDACKRLRNDYQSRDRVWASFGDYDRRQFERQCEAMGIGNPFGPTHLNVKNLHALVRGLHREVGMATALEQWQLPLEGVHHRGHDDAWNIAAILSKILDVASNDVA